MSVAVIIPCFNRSATLGRAIKSALAQTVPVAEIIVVDDGSSDGSADEARRHGPLVRVLEQPNRGAAHARNSGLDASVGDWVAFLDSDDEWHPEKLAAQLAAADRFPDAQLIFCDTRTLGQTEVLMPSRFALGGLYGAEVTKDGDCALYDRSLFSRMLTHARVITSAVMIRNRLPGLRFPEDIWGSEDWALWLTLALQYPFASVDRVLVTMHQQGDNISSRKSRLYRNVVKVLEGLLQRQELTADERTLVAQELSSRRIGAFYHSLFRGEVDDARELLARVPPKVFGWPRYQIYRLLCRCPPRVVRSLAGLRRLTDGPES